ncbi:dolichyl-phosphate beta-glucosyltransferase [Aphis craccivora]|uniref:dolichyl-phosphate beta-glucosyltransferase n=1 Tax=Aphis craccivora TaxID=307492 RepID=A0A6G0YZJ5_APHCR|nr:dolichyl-phosphate beta-glucosyltransferase [Aphis craccivora]
MGSAAVILNSDGSSPQTLSFVELLPYLYQTFIGLTVLCVVYINWMLYYRRSPCAHEYRADNEKHFTDENGKQVPFPSLSDGGTLDLSVIVPAYNEQDRIRPMLDSCLKFLTDVSRKWTFEVIVVSDGSTDGTCDVVMEYVRQYGSDQIRLLKLYENRGKGGAVSLGMHSARGRTLLFADADGATSFQDLEQLESALLLLASNDMTEYAKKLHAVVCGSRAHLETESMAQRSIFRTFLMVCFHFHVWLFGVRSIKDTQCGFKLFTRPAARILFNNLHVKGWAFDVEMLYIAEELKFKLVEVPVHWTEIEGSKIVPVWSWLEMGYDVLKIWFKYRIGSWVIRK